MSCRHLPHDGQSTFVFPKVVVDFPCGETGTLESRCQPEGLSEKRQLGGRHLCQQPLDELLECRNWRVTLDRHRRQSRTGNEAYGKAIVDVEDLWQRAAFADLRSRRTRVEKNGPRRNRQRVS